MGPAGVSRWWRRVWDDDAVSGAQPEHGVVHGWRPWVPTKGAKWICLVGPQVCCAAQVCGAVASGSLERGSSLLRGSTKPMQMVQMTGSVMRVLVVVVAVCEVDDVGAGAQHDYSNGVE